MPVESAEGYSPIAVWPQGGISRAGLSALPENQEMLGFLQKSEWVIDLAEYRESPDTYQNVELPKFLREDERIRLVIPLLQQEELKGFVVLAEPPPPFELTYEDRDLLKTVGSHVATHLAQHEADRRLSESRQFEAYHRLTAFVMHDLKNLAAQLSLLVANAEKHKRNPEFVDDAIGTIANSTTRMQRLIEQLRRRDVQSLNRTVSLAQIARRACTQCAIRSPEPVLESAAADALAIADPERLTMMVEHLIRNAQEATGEQGTVTVSVSTVRGVEATSLSATGTYPSLAGQAEDADESGTPLADRHNDASSTASGVDIASLSVTDTGAGMSEDFVKERLFKPFDTTKGSKGMGIGAYQVREYVKSIGGRLKVRSRTGQGTCITLLLPLAESPADEFDQRERLG